MDKAPIVILEKPIIGISACCMGCPVRYNGKGFDLLKGLGREKGDFTWVPVCPECLAGLGVIRDPVHIAGENGSAVWRGEATVRGRGGRDVTADMITGCQVALDNLRRAGVRAFVYMDGSPSCGVYRTTLKNQKRGKPPGVFGDLLNREGFFLIPALDLQSPLKWWDWRRRLLAYLWLTDTPLGSKGDAYEIWNRLKFICQEIDDPWARSKGRELAAWGRRVEPGILENFKLDVLNLLRRPSTNRRLTASLLKSYAFYRKSTGQSIPEIGGPESRRNVTTVARELGLVERAAAKSGRFTGSSPVLYSGRISRKQPSVEQREDV